jgi:hypothetical protein
MEGPDVKELDSDYYTLSASFDLEQLIPGTRYFLLVIATDMSGIEASRDLLGFDTEAQGK